MSDAVTIRPASADDVPFLVEAICEAEKAGTDVLSYCRIFSLEEAEFHRLLAEMLAEDLEGQELCISGFLLAEIAGELVGSCCAWVEGAGGSSSAILKANLLLHGIDRERMRRAQVHFQKLEQLYLARQSGAIQLESFYVRGRGRWRGVAALLLDAQIARLRSAATVAKAQLILTGTNPVARAAYERAGFSVAAERWSSDQSLLALVPSLGKLLMERPVTGNP